MKDFRDTLINHRVEQIDKLLRKSECNHRYSIYSLWSLSKISLLILHLNPSAYLDCEDSIRDVHHSLYTITHEIGLNYSRVIPHHTMCWPKLFVRDAILAEFSKKALVKLEVCND